MKNFQKLDVAAKVFPSVTNKDNSSVFRVSVVLKEEVDPYILQLAVNMIYERYRLFFLRLRRGVFWNYFDKNYNYFTVEEEKETPCNSIISFENSGYIIKVLYYKNRISVEAFHAITDGGGISEFVKSLVYYYICIKHGNIDHQGKIILFDSKEKNDYDSFSEYFTGIEKKKMPVIRKGKKTYKITGSKYRKGGHCVVTGILSVNTLKSYCKEHECTITAFLVANMIWSIYLEKQEAIREKKSIVITVPVNLRKSFDSRTLKNFFAVVKIGYEMNDETKFEDIVFSASQQLKELTNADYLKNASRQNVNFSNNILSRNTPLVLKNIIIPIGFNYIGELKKTITISNIGNLNFPDGMNPYIKHTQVFSYPTKKSPVNCTICSSEDKLSINFIRSIKDVSIIRRFFTSLVQNTGVDVTVYSNMWGEKYE